MTNLNNEIKEIHPIMFQLIIFVIGVLSAWYWWTKLKAMTPSAKSSYIRWSAFWIVLAIALVLVRTGTMHWIGAGLAALLPLISFLFKWGRRALPIVRILSRFKTVPSQFKTKSLAVTINFSNQHMDGKVLTGAFVDKLLSELTIEQLDILASEFKKNDRESAALLYAYRLRNGNSKTQEQDKFTSQELSGLSVEEARDILGVTAESSSDDIIKAHKRLMQRLHPDRGGSGYLAAKINAAKDTLI